MKTISISYDENFYNEEIIGIIAKHFFLIYESISSFVEATDTIFSYTLIVSSTLKSNNFINSLKYKIRYT